MIPLQATNLFRFSKMLVGTGEGEQGKPSGGTDGSLITDESKISPELKQKLIDKGVDIGFARGSDKADKAKAEAVDALLKDSGVTKEELAKFKDLKQVSESIKGVLGHFGVDSVDALSKKLDEEARAKMSASERAQNDLKRAEQSIKDKASEVESLQKLLSVKAEEAKKREEQLLGTIKRVMVTRELTDAAIANNAYDPTDVTTRLQDRVRLDEQNGEFVPVVLNDRGDKAFDQNGKPIGIQILVAGFLSEKPHLVKAGVTKGAGSEGPPKGGAPTGGTSEFTAEQLKDSTFFQKNMGAIIEAVKAGRIKTS